MPIYKKINKNFFKKWNHQMAYILGFIFADGNIIKTKRGTWFFSIQITDIEVLDFIKKEMDSSHIISKRKKKNGHKQLYRLQVGSSEICNDLISLGVVEKKSKIMKFPKIPNNFIFDFIRGYFDGDGGVWVGTSGKKYLINTYFTSGSLVFLESLHKILLNSGLKGGSMVKKERGYELKFSIKDSFLLYKNMYNSKCIFFLKRKKDLFEKYIKCSRSSTG